MFNVSHTPVYIMFVSLIYLYEKEQDMCASISNVHKLKGSLFVTVLILYLIVNHTVMKEFDISTRSCMKCHMWTLEPQVLNQWSLIPVMQTNKNMTRTCMLCYLKESNCMMYNYHDYLSLNPFCFEL